MNTSMNVPPLPALAHDSTPLRRDAKIERRIVWNMLHVLAAAGYVPHAVDDACGGERENVSNPIEAMEAIFDVDDARVYFRSVNNPTEPPQWVLLIGGNGEDIFSDYTCRAGTAFTAAMDAFNPEKAW